MFSGVLARNLRVAVRALLRTPAFTITVVLTLALGIGANSAVFSAIDAVLLKPLPFPESGQLMRLTEHNPQNTETGVAPVRLIDWDRRNASFQAITGYYTEDGSEVTGDLPERVKRAFVAPRFLEVWGVAPALGRDFTPDEARFGGPPAVLISDRFWRKRFHADPGALGKSLRFGIVSFPIVGIMPASFLFPDRDVDVWSPVAMDAPYAQSRYAVWFTTIARLKPDVTLEQARANLSAVQIQLGKDFGPPDNDLTVQVHPLKETAVGGVRQSLWVVFGAVSVLLLIACTNIAGLLLARSAQREHEVAVRFSLGASRMSVALQLLTEAFVLSTAGAALGLGLAVGAMRVFRTLAAGLPRIDEIALDGRILVYTLACAVAATFLCGIVPALRGSRRDTRGTLTHSGRTQVSARHSTQWALVGVQVALAVTLLAGAGLLLRSMQELGRVSPGFDASNVLTLRVSNSWAEPPTWARPVVDFLETVPGVEYVSTGYSLPGIPTEYPVELILEEGRAETEPRIIAESRFVSPAYFDLMRIPLLSGEGCREDPNPAYIGALVNRSFASKYFPSSEAIGHNLRIATSTGLPLRILGIVADARETGIHRAPTPVLYGCSGNVQPMSWFLIRTRGEAAGMIGTLRLKLREIEPTRSMYEALPLEQRLNDAFAENRLRTVLLSFFAVTAVSLASVGLYGTLSYFVSLRRREVGLRLALGAGRGRIVRHFLARGLLVATLGCVAGLALALGFTRVLAGMLFGVSSWDPATFSAVILAMMGVAAVASLLPSARAAVLEPMQVLREE